LLTFSPSPFKASFAFYYFSFLLSLLSSFLESSPSSPASAFGASAPCFFFLSFEASTYASGLIPVFPPETCF
jgi:hypothetical protein